MLGQMVQQTAGSTVRSVHRTDEAPRVRQQLTESNVILDKETDGIGDQKILYRTAVVRISVKN